MDNLDPKELIKCELGQLKLSESFKKQSSLMGFDSLGDILSIQPKQLLNKEGFDYNWLGELVTFLSDRKLLHLLQPLQENNQG